MQRFRLTLISQVWKLARRSKVCERPEHLQEDVLREILGLLVRADELVRDVEHAAPVLRDDGLPGALVAFRTALNQLVGGGLRCGGLVGGHVWGLGRQVAPT